MVVRPNQVAENWHKIVNNYWNGLALDVNRWTSRQSWYIVMYVLEFEDVRTTEFYSGELE
jgi:hypothetical protein